VIPHYAPIANIMQIATHHRLNDPDWEDQRFRPGDISCGGKRPFDTLCKVVINFKHSASVVSYVMLPSATHLIMT
jgi:hypothetical protein